MWYVSFVKVADTEKVEDVDNSSGMRIRVLKTKVLSHLFCFLFGCTLAWIFIYQNNIDTANKSEIDLFEKNNVMQFKNLKHSYFLVILILTSSKNYIRRKNIRETWIKKIEKYQIKYLFSIGNKDNIVDIKLKEELYEHDDILLLDDVQDEYSSLSQKVLQSFKYMYENYDFQYLLKCDDDTFVRVSNVINELQTKFENHKKLYWGYFDGRARIRRVGKWQEKNWFLCDRYLPYALGGGYILSHSLVKFISDNSDILSTYMSEDVSVGVWLSALNITRYHDVRFDTEFQSRGCHNSYLIVHKRNMYELQNNLMLSNQDRLCQQEQQDRSAYEYNWKVPPSQCCARNDTKKIT